jgi:hypothetical protein
MSECQALSWHRAHSWCSVSPGQALPAMLPEANRESRTCLVIPGHICFAQDQLGRLPGVHLELLWKTELGVQPSWHQSALSMCPTSTLGTLDRHGAPDSSLGRGPCWPKMRLKGTDPQEGH